MDCPHCQADMARSDRLCRACGEAWDRDEKRAPSKRMRRRPPAASSAPLIAVVVAVLGLVGLGGVFVVTRAPVGATGPELAEAPPKVIERPRATASRDKKAAPRAESWLERVAREDVEARAKALAEKRAREFLAPTLVLKKREPTAKEVDEIVALEMETSRGLSRFLGQVARLALRIGASETSAKDLLARFADGAGAGLEFTDGELEQQLRAAMIERGETPRK